MPSSIDTNEDLNLQDDETNLDDETISSTQLKSLFDDYAARFSLDTSHEIIHALSTLHWPLSSYYLSHLPHKIVSLVYDRLTKFIEKLVLTSNVLSNDEVVLMDECLDFITRVFGSAYSMSLGNEEENDEEEDNDTNDDISIPDEATISILDKLCGQIAPLNDSFLKLVQSAGWKIMKNDFEIMSKVVGFLLRRHKINIIRLKFSKNVNLSLERLTEENQQLFDTFVECINSSEGSHDYLEAINQLDSISLNERSKFLLFDSFNFIINNNLYTEDFRTKFCRDFWLSKYKQILKEMLIKTTEQINETFLRLNAIKYLITNLIQMQRKTESNFMFSKGQIENFALKDEYLPIIMMLLPWFSNSYILKNLMKNNDEPEKKIFQLNKNYSNNTKDGVTIPFVTWTILKLILMFINANGDCLAYIKHDKSVKEILLKLLSQIKEYTSIKVYIYNILGLLFDEKDIQNEPSITKEIIMALITYIRNIHEEVIEDSLYLTDLLTLLRTLKAYLQHDQLKSEFIRHQGLALLMEIAMKKSRWIDFALDIQECIGETVDMDDLYSSNELPEELQKVYGANIKATEEGQQLALECFFTMSFDAEAAYLLKNNARFMTYIQHLAEGKIKTMNPGLKKAADSVLWKLKTENEFKKTQQETISTNKNEFDLMISYSWGDKPLVRQIYKYLTENYNYRVWLDENEMTGSLCRSMAQIIEKSSVILMCMSETYKKSENCRNEAEYAWDRKKTIIPLKMAQVELDDWLGFIAVDKMYIDFGRSNFEKSIILLKAEIERNEMDKKTTKQVTKVETTNSLGLQSTVAPSPLMSNLLVRPNVIPTDYQQIPIESWSERHVRDFIFDKKLDIMILLTENMNGSELYELWELCRLQQECWPMFDRLSRELEQQYKQTLPISVYLRFLHQIPKHSNISSTL
ncbi:unnamed protein product [Rotaria sp. Silwood2]|nr:unnamed protein product [Rotaria sp. Silwood2]CAF4140846.1 unnamed protein product [Rotaria sp. Silwood2]CAF4409728.1 unnamed protein product [Rotaria sp. Silwood2]